MCGGGVHRPHLRDPGCPEGAWGIRGASGPPMCLQAGRQAGVEGRCEQASSSQSGMPRGGISVAETTETKAHCHHHQACGCCADVLHTPTPHQHSGHTHIGKHTHTFTNMPLPSLVHPHHACPRAVWRVCMRTPTKPPTQHSHPPSPPHPSGSKVLKVAEARRVEVLPIPSALPLRASRGAGVVRPPWAGGGGWGA